MTFVIYPTVEVVKISVTQPYCSWIPIPGITNEPSVDLENLHKS